MAFLSAASVGGVFAIWTYSRDTALPQTAGFSIGLTEFVWKPDEILPTESEIGENYLALLDFILNSRKGGLNSDKDTLEKAVLKDGIVHSSQNVTGGNLKHLFITEESKELDFLVERKSAEEFHIYMFENDDAEQGIVNVTNIKVYKTIVVFDGNTWIAQESQLGYAVIEYIKNSAYIAIDPGKWIRGNLSA